MWTGYHDPNTPGPPSVEQPQPSGVFTATTDHLPVPPYNSNNSYHAYHSNSYHAYHSNSYHAYHSNSYHASHTLAPTHFSPPRCVNPSLQHLDSRWHTNQQTHFYQSHATIDNQYGYHSYSSHQHLNPAPAGSLNRVHPVVSVSPLQQQSFPRAPSSLITGPAQSHDPPQHGGHQTHGYPCPYPVDASSQVWRTSATQGAAYSVLDDSARSRNQYGRLSTSASYGYPKSSNSSGYNCHVNALTSDVEETQQIPPEPRPSWQQQTCSMNSTRPSIDNTPHSENISTSSAVNPSPTIWATAPRREQSLQFTPDVSPISVITSRQIAGELEDKHRTPTHTRSMCKEVKQAKLGQNVAVTPSTPALNQSVTRNETAKKNSPPLNIGFCIPRENTLKRQKSTHDHVLSREIPSELEDKHMIPNILPIFKKVKQTESGQSAAIVSTATIPLLDQSVSRNATPTKQSPALNIGFCVPSEDTPKHYQSTSDHFLSTSTTATSRSRGMLTTTCSQATPALHSLDLNSCLKKHNKKPTMASTIKRRLMCANSQNDSTLHHFWNSPTDGICTIKSSNQEKGIKRSSTGQDIAASSRPPKSFKPSSNCKSIGTNSQLCTFSLSQKVKSNIIAKLTSVSHRLKQNAEATNTNVVEAADSAQPRRSITKRKTSPPLTDCRTEQNRKQLQNTSAEDSKGTHPTQNPSALTFRERPNGKSNVSHDKYKDLVSMPILSKLASELVEPMTNQKKQEKTPRVGSLAAPELRGIRGESTSQSDLMSPPPSSVVMRRNATVMDQNVTLVVSSNHRILAKVLGKVTSCMLSQFMLNKNLQSLQGAYREEQHNVVLRFLCTLCKIKVTEVMEHKARNLRLLKTRESRAPTEEDLHTLINHFTQQAADGRPPNITIADFTVGNSPLSTPHTGHGAIV